MDFVWFRFGSVAEPHLIGECFDTQQKQLFATNFGSFDIYIDHSDIASAFGQLETNGTTNTICSARHLNDRKSRNQKSLRTNHFWMHPPRPLDFGYFSMPSEWTWAQMIWTKSTHRASNTWLSLQIRWPHCGRSWWLIFPMESLVRIASYRTYKYLPCRFRVRSECYQSTYFCLIQRLARSDHPFILVPSTTEPWTWSAWNYNFTHF